MWSIQQCAIWNGFDETKAGEGRKNGPNDNYIISVDVTMQ